MPDEPADSMTMARRILTLVLLIATLIAAAVPASAKDAEDETAKVRLETKKTPAVVQGGTTWIAINWRGADADATDFRITATSKATGVEISYPANTDGHSSLMDNDVLSSDEIDFTSLNVVVPYGTKQFKIDIVASWNDGKKDVEKKFNVTVPTVEYKGEDAALVAESIGVAAASQPWVDVAWSGMAPSLDQVRMTVDGPPEAATTYPGDGSSSGLSRDSRLDQGETDVAGFRLDTAEMKPGSYEFKVLLAYERDGKPSSVSGIVLITVTE